VTLTADDFGLSEAVNEGVERAHREGVLDAASLMVGAPAAADAVRRARRMPGLRVGLHLVAVEGPAVLPRAAIPALVGVDGWFPGGQGRLGGRYFFLPWVRRQLAAEIRAQFEAFAATGLALAHADAHKHMHLHPTVGRLLVETGREFGLARVRVPAEPPSVMAGLGVRGGGVLHAWSRLLRAQVRRAGMASSDSVFGLAWSGGMTAGRVRRLLEALPEGGDVEIYFHPASRREALLERLMPGYDHVGELAALLDPGVRAALGR
jgi:chitin disaccharide deacetylase